MKTFETCPCGIAKVDCDYHKPEETRDALDDYSRRMLGELQDYIFRSSDYPRWASVRCPAWGPTELEEEAKDDEDDEDPEADEDL